jgi:hypothetical protein
MMKLRGGNSNFRSLGAGSVSSCSSAGVTGKYCQTFWIHRDTLSSTSSLHHPTLPVQSTCGGSTFLWNVRTLYDWRWKNSKTMYLINVSIWWRNCVSDNYFWYSETHVYGGNKYFGQKISRTRKTEKAKCRISYVNIRLWLCEMGRGLRVDRKKHSVSRATVNAERSSLLGCYAVSLVSTDRPKDGTVLSSE